MNKVTNISEFGISIDVKDTNGISFTARNRENGKDIEIPFRKFEDSYYINFADLEVCLNNNHRKVFYDFFLWKNGVCVERIVNSRKDAREVSKVIETVNKVTQINKKVTITPFRTSRNTLGCEIITETIDEKSFQSENGIEINYVEKIMKNGLKNKLIVTFPYNSPVNPKIKKSAAFYQYQKTLSNIGVSKIFLKDGGGKVGNWFLGFGNFDYRDATIEFLESKIKELGINKEDVIFFGVSKGGYNAILFGLILGISNVVVSSAIGKIYSFLGNRNQNSYIFPQDMSESKKEMYDNLIRQAAINTINKPNIYIITNKNDEYYTPHIPYLKEVFEENNIPHQIYHNPNPEITRHGLIYKKSRNEINNLLFSLICGENSIKKIE